MKSYVKIFNTVAYLREDASHNTQIGRRSSQMLYGEEFDIKGIIHNEWAHGTAVLDGYSGFLHLSDLLIANEPPTHAVSTLMTHAYQRPDIKTQPSMTLSFMSRVMVQDQPEENGFVMIRDNAEYWVKKAHLIAIDDLAANPADIVETAQMFSAAPYLYSGRSAMGVDCSALVQLALQRNGIASPRDSDQQQDVIGRPVNSISDLRRGDIVYFPGHVGIMVDKENILNATERYMRVVTEPLDKMALCYGRSTKDAILSIRRLDF